LAAGCIVIASDVPACREVLQNGRYGYLVEAGNPKAMADMVIKVLQNPQDNFTNQMAYVEQFSPSVMIKGYLDFAKK
jgi:glycosyltransferase involved in cell wall biosynthesis